MNTKEIREKYGYTQKKLAELVGVSIKTVQDWEQGRSNPDRRSKIGLEAKFPNEWEVAAVRGDDSVYEDIDK